MPLWDGIEMFIWLKSTSIALLNWRTITRSNGNLAIRTSQEKIWFYCPGKRWWNHLCVDGRQESQIVHPKNIPSFISFHLFAIHIGIFSTIISFTYVRIYTNYMCLCHIIALHCKISSILFQLVNFGLKILFWFALTNEEKEQQK